MSEIENVYKSFLGLREEYNKTMSADHWSSKNYEQKYNQKMNELTACASLVNDFYISTFLPVHGNSGVETIQNVETIMKNIHEKISSKTNWPTNIQVGLLPTSKEDNTPGFMNFIIDGLKENLEK